MGEYIYFINLTSGATEKVKKLPWVAKNAGKITASMIANLEWKGRPVAFATVSSHGEEIIVVDDKSINDPFIMYHEEGHHRLGHFKRPMHTDNCGCLDDDDAEKAADRYAVQKVGLTAAMRSLKNIIENTNDGMFAIEVAGRMLALQLNK